MSGKVHNMRRSYENLPDGIVADIFYRLPAKSIGRCRCVSKPWRALLSQPNFIRSLLNQNIHCREESLLLIADVPSTIRCAPLPDAHQVFDEITNPAPRLTFTFPQQVYEGTYLCSAPFRDAHQVFDDITIPVTKLAFANHTDSWTQVYGSCDGLVLVGDIERKKFVLNPTTREIREVPSSPFALDPRKSCIMYGLGYDSVNDDYKIVTISYYDGGNDVDKPFRTEMFVNVYSLKTGTWKKAESSPYDHAAVGHITSGVFVNGCIHWIAFRKPDDEFVVLAFDFAEEKFREVLPPSSVDMFLFSLLVVLDGCLSMFRAGENCVWVMKEYGVQDSWTKFMIDDPEEEEYTPLCSMLGHEEIVLINDDEKMVKYNLKDGSKKDIVVHGVQDDLLAKVSFVESLVSPNYGPN